LSEVKPRLTIGGDFELTIPRVPSVAEVDEAVQLEIDFVALPA